MRTEAKENTDKLWNLFESDSGDSSFAREIEEAELLWKLGEKGKALRGIENVLESTPENVRALEVASSLYLGNGQPKKARPLIEALEKKGGESRPLLELRGDLAFQEKKWKEAREVYETLLKASPESYRYRLAYADSLSALREWKKSLPLYRELVRDKKRGKALYLAYLENLDQGASQFETVFAYYHRPSSEKIHIIGEKGSFWLSPWLRMGAKMTEEVYRKQARVLPVPVSLLLMTHSVEAELFYGPFFSFLADWTSNYYVRTAFQEMKFEERFRRGMLDHRMSFQWAHVSRDPVEALVQRGRVNRWETSNSLMFWDRLKGNNDIFYEWYSMDGTRNQINGSSDLGYKLTNDCSVELILWRKPYLSMNYHYRVGQWRRPFGDAETLIGYLPYEQTHYGGFYMEERFSQYFGVNWSVSRGSDRKRKVDFVIWNFRGDLFLRDHVKMSFAYEFDYGDSGTAGPGNTQIFTTTLKAYF